MTILLVLMSCFCFAMSIARVKITGTPVFLFLNWNLFLAFIPWLISSIMVVRRVDNKLLLTGLALLWLLFFPNSPYILTDLFHLHAQSSVPVWFDLVLILSFAWTGLMYGFISLMDIETLLRQYISRERMLLLSAGALFLAGFGIYLGRFLRWNSWDVLHHPLGLLSDIADRFADPTGHPRTWGVTIMMGILLNMMYFSLKLLKDSPVHTSQLKRVF